MSCLLDNLNYMKSVDMAPLSFYYGLWTSQCRKKYIISRMMRKQGIIEGFVV